MSEAAATRIVRLEVTGMGCDGCVGALVELKGGMAQVEATAGTDPSVLVAAVEEAGYDARATV